MARKESVPARRTIEVDIAPEIDAGVAVGDVVRVTSPGAALTDWTVMATPAAVIAREMNRDEIRRTPASRYVEASKRSEPIVDRFARR
jgi:hypothetical protein